MNTEVRVAFGSTFPSGVSINFRSNRDAEKSTKMFAKLIEIGKYGTTRKMLGNSPQAVG